MGGTYDIIPVARLVKLLKLLDSIQLSNSWLVFLVEINLDISNDLWLIINHCNIYWSKLRSSSHFEVSSQLFHHRWKIFNINQDLCMAERCTNCNWDRGIHAHRHAHSCLHLYAHVSWTLLSREVLYLNQVEILMEIYQQTQRTAHHHTHSTHTTRTHTSSSYAEEVQTFRKTNVKGKSETKIEIFHSFVERVRRRRWMQCPPWQTLPLFPILFSRFTAPLLSLLPALLLSKAVAI